jgi:hypothetical protein
MEGLTFERVQLSRNKIEINIDAIDPNILDRFGLKYFLDIYVPDGYLSTTYKKLITLEASEVPPYDKDGVTIYEGAYFPIDQYLDSFLSYTLPTPGQTAVTIADELTMPYRLTKRCMNGDVVLEEMTLPEQWVMKAGVRENEFRHWGDVLFSDTFSGFAGKFLTYHRGKRKVRPGQPEFLYYLINCSPTPQTVTVKYGFEHLKLGTYRTADLTLETVAISGGFQVLIIPVDIETLQLDSLDYGIIEEYEVWLTNEGGFDISERKKFEVDTRYSRNVKYLLYNNSLGAFETGVFLGETAGTLSVQRETSERYVPFLSDATFSERVVNEVTGERQLIVNTGFLPVDEFSVYDDIFFSKQIYVCDDGELYPLELITEQNVSSKSDERLRGINLTFRHSNKERNYSRLGAAPTVVTRATAWRGFGTVNCLIDSRGIFTGLGSFGKLELFCPDNNEPVRPSQIKNNTAGTVGYIAPAGTGVCATTPFLNVAINRASTFQKNNCDVGFRGNFPTLSIAAGSYGSTLSLADANAKAEAAWQLANTQAAANAAGTCVLDFGAGLRGFFRKLSHNSFPNFNTAPFFERITNTIDFVTQQNNFIYNDVPGWNSSEGYYSAHWAGKVKAKRTGTIRFKIKHDEGCKAIVNGVTRLDNLSYGVFTSYFDVPMTANEYYDFEVFYFEANIAGNIKVEWETQTGSGIYELVDTFYHVL